MCNYYIKYNKQDRWTGSNRRASRGGEEDSTTRGRSVTCFCMFLTCSTSYCLVTASGIYGIYIYIYMYVCTYVHCMLDNEGYILTLKICNIYCYSTATMVMWMHFNVMLYIHCLSCYTIVLTSQDQFWWTGMRLWDWQVGFPPLFYYAADHSQLSQAVFHSKQLIVIVIT